MNSKHQKTLEAIFATPTKTNVEFSAIEKLFVALGGIVIEGRGSRVRFAFGDKIASFHRPHPQKEARPYQVEAAREFLERIGFKP
ncbi:MAG: pilus assembly protein HicB [Candidatus Riflebacteria bacterium GWC2_50_8]|nr:MAG: pilus assembly protein HicB [Candidatus Riflebacteria bacterium GWC2_50_8]